MLSQAIATNFWSKYLLLRCFKVFWRSFAWPSGAILSLQNKKVESFKIVINNICGLKMDEPSSNKVL